MRSQIRHRRFVLGCALVAVFALATVPLGAQTPRTDGAAASNWTHPRTAWGDPDLSGLWRGLHRINFERPPELRDREFLTDKEVLDLERKADERNANRLLGKAENRGNRNQPNYNSIVSYTEDKARYAKRTSAIVDPPTGLLPDWTPEQVKYYEFREEMSKGRGDADSWVDRPTSERCIPVIAFPVMEFWGMTLRGSAGGVAETAGTNNQGEGFSNLTDGGGPYRIVQGPGFVVILEEEQGLGGGPNGSRVVPIDSRPTLSKKFRHWMGSPRGHWEGNTLVVKTTNIMYPGPIITPYGPNYPGSGETLTFTERFTRTGADTIEYRYTVDDPGVYATPYSVQHQFTRDDAYKISNVICHEGHDDMPSALAAGRFDEVTSIDNAADTRLQRAPRIKELKEQALAAAAKKR